MHIRLLDRLSQNTLWLKEQTITTTNIQDKADFPRFKLIVLNHCISIKDRVRMSLFADKCELNYWFAHHNFAHLFEPIVSIRELPTTYLTVCIHSCIERIVRFSNSLFLEIRTFGNSFARLKLYSQSVFLLPSCWVKRKHGRLEMLLNYVKRRTRSVWDSVIRRH